MCTQPITNYSPFLEKSMLNIFWSKKLSQKPINHHRGPTTQHVEDEACLSKCENAFPWEWPLTLLSGWTLWGCPYPALVRWHPARWHHHILVIVRPPCLPLRAGPPCQGYDTLPLPMTTALHHTTWNCTSKVRTRPSSPICETSERAVGVLWLWVSPKS